MTLWDCRKRSVTYVAKLHEAFKPKLIAMYFPSVVSDHYSAF